MTTVDVYIEASNTAGTLLSLHNGLFGPATRVMHAIQSAALQGEAHQEGDIDTVVQGTILRRILGETDLDAPHDSGSPTLTQLHHFIEVVLRDEATYRVTCIEF